MVFSEINALGRSGPDFTTTGGRPCDDGVTTARRLSDDRRKTGGRLGDDLGPDREPLGICSFVIPAQAGIQAMSGYLDARFRGRDDK